MNSAVAAALQVGVVIVVIALAYRPLGDHMARTFTSDRDLAPERWFYRIVRVDPRSGQTWVGYAAAVLAFSAVGVLFLYALQRVQSLLPGSDGRAGVPPATAFNTAVSFVTNTNWQSYSPEQVMSNVTQAAGLAVQNFVSAAVGLAVAIALIRGIVARARRDELGNFWVDMIRAVIRILLPLSIVLALILLTQGAVQSFRSGFDFVGLDGAAGHAVVGPFASQEAIKELGTNGGGTLATNSAHPFSNLTPLSNVVQIIAILLIPVCLTRTYSTMVGDRRQGYTVLAVMTTLFAAILTVTWVFAERVSGVAGHAAGAMTEGTEQRFGIPGSVLYAVATTGTSTGAVNAQHDSLSAASGGAVLWNMLLGEVAPGGVGSGLYGILVLAVVAVFVGGLLVGRNPQFLGKRIGQHEITMAAMSILVMPVLVLVGTAITIALPSTRDAQGNSGDPGSAASVHGFTEVLYAFASAANNNGSAFGGLTASNTWLQGSLAVAMLLGRFLPIVFTLALAGLLARQTPAPTSSAALPTHGPMYGALLLGTVVLVAGLTFFPALALGPIAEALA